MYGLATWIFSTEWVLTITLRPLAESLGAEVSGIDWLQPVDAEIIDQIKDALMQYHVLCLRTEPLSTANFARVGRYFGEPQLQLLRDARDATTPEVSVFDSTYPTAESKPVDLNLDRRSGWHTDDSYFPTPAKITLLQALATPENGGETRFCNAKRAFETLDTATQQRYAALQAVHSYDTIRAPARAQKRNDIETAETNDVVHPLIRTHDETGERAIYFNSNRTDHIIGLSRAQSDALLDDVHRHMTRDEFQYHHRWRVGDILVWDNRSVTHSVNMDFPPGQPRIHQRLLLKGPRPD